MRHIVLSDDGFDVASNAYHRLLVVSFLPESPRDQEQGLLIGAMEQAVFDRVGAEHYQPSEIMDGISRLLQKRTAQYYLTGFMCIALVWLKISGQTPSLNRASIITSCAANDFQKIRWQRALDPGGKEYLTAATSDPASLERIFRKYRCVAHLCAADISSTHYLQPAHLFDKSPEVIGALLMTCATFQAALEDCMNTRDWNLWDVKRHFPASLNGWPALFPDAQIWAVIERGYDQAVSQGLIKR